MLSNIKDLIARFRRPDAGSADLAATLEDARAVLAAAEGAMVEAERAYTAGLLEHDGPKLQGFRAAREAATVERDRATALVASLETRLAQTLDAEAEAVAGLIRKRYPRLAGDLVALLMRIERSDAAVRAMNNRLIAKDRGGDRLEGAEARALPARTSPHSPAHTLWGGILIRGIEGFAPGWHVDGNYQASAEPPPENKLWTDSDLWTA